MGVDLLSGLGDGHAHRVTVEQGQTQLVFQRLDGLADVWLGGVECVSGLFEAAQIDACDKILQLFEFHGRLRVRYSCPLSYGKACAPSSGKKTHRLKLSDGAKGEFMQIS